MVKICVQGNGSLDRFAHNVATIYSGEFAAEVTCHAHTFAQEAAAPGAHVTRLFSQAICVGVLMGLKLGAQKLLSGEVKLSKVEPEPPPESEVGP